MPLVPVFGCSLDKLEPLVGRKPKVAEFGANSANPKMSTAARFRTTQYSCVSSSGTGPWPESERVRACIPQGNSGRGADATATGPIR